jgi:hypothetical protein
MSSVIDPRSFGTISRPAVLQFVRIYHFRLFYNPAKMILYMSSYLSRFP